MKVFPVEGAGARLDDMAEGQIPVDLLKPAGFALFLCLLLLSPLTALAQGRGFQINPEGEIRYNALEIHPGLIYELTYDDNIFKEKSSEEDDLINKVIPSLGLRLPFAGARHELNLSGEARFWSFADRTDENHQDYLGRGSFIFRPGRRLELNSGVSYEDTEDPSTSEQQSVTGPRTPRTQLIGSLGGEWTFSPKTRFSLAGDFTEDRFKRVLNNRLEKNTFRVTAEGFRQVFPKTSVVLGYTFGGTDFVNRPATDSNDDSLTHTVLAGIDLDPTAKLSGRLTAGASLREFDQSGRDEEVDFSVGTDLTWRPLARTTLGLLVLREFADTSTRREFAIVRTTFQVTGNQAFTEKIAVNLFGGAVLDDFVESDRDDITYTVNGGVTYRLLRWLRVGFRYQYEKKDSDVNVNDYAQNQFVFSLAGRF